jgi:hypothetical protein
VYCAYGSVCMRAHFDVFECGILVTLYVKGVVVLWFELLGWLDVYDSVSALKGAKDCE